MLAPKPRSIQFPNFLVSGPSFKRVLTTLEIGESPLKVKRPVVITHKTNNTSAKIISKVFPDPNEHRS